MIKKSRNTEPTKIENIQQYTAGEQQGIVEPYSPTDIEAMHICHIYKRRMDIYNWMTDLGVFAEWEMCQSVYMNPQKEPKEQGEITPANIGTVIELVETKTSDEKKVLPEVVLKPFYNEDANKVEALQQLLEYVANKDQDDLKKGQMLDLKSVFGVAYRYIPYVETYRNIKEVTKVKGDKVIEWKTHRVLDRKGIYSQCVYPYELFLEIGSTSIDDSPIAIFHEYKDYDTTEQEYGNFPNFKYVRKGNISDVIVDMFLKKDINYAMQVNTECCILKYWNRVRDEYSIVINGVLMTEYSDSGGSPIPYKYWKDIPFSRWADRTMPGKRRLFPKGVIALTERLIRLKNILVNAATKGAMIMASPVIALPESIVADLQKLGMSWEVAGILTSHSKEDADQIEHIPIQIDISGLDLMIRRIDEIITTVTGIDSRSLLSTADETATKTAVKQETAIKRIATGLKLIENEALYRETKIKMSIIKQFYQEEDEYIIDDDLGKDDPRTIKVPKSISVQNKKFEWVEKTKPIPEDVIVQTVTDGGLDIKDVNRFFINVNNDYKFIVESLEELNKYCMETGVTQESHDALVDLYNKSKYNDLNKIETEGESHALELRKELFETEYNIMIVPRGAQSYSELFKQDQVMKLADFLINSPNVDRYEVDKEVVKAMGGMDSTKVLISREEQQKMQMMQQAQIQSEQEQGGQEQGVQQLPLEQVGITAPNMPAGMNTPQIPPQVQAAIKKTQQKTNVSNESKVNPLSSRKKS